MKNTIKKIYKKIKKIINSIKEIKKINNIINMESYYPEKTRKNKIVRYLDNLKWIFNYGTVNKFYNLYGMDLQCKNKDNEYCDYNIFMEQRNQYNMNVNTPKNKYNYVALLRDKNIFEKIINSLGIKTANTVAIIKDGITYDKNLDKIINEEELFRNGKQYFVKSINGECAENIFYIKKYEEFIEKRSKFDNGIYIIQDKLIQNDEMNRLSPHAVNTLRVVTVNNGENISILATVCRIGMQSNNNVDNWAAGGLAVEVKQNGYLNKYGYYKPGYGTKVEVHPDTKIEFEKFKIPYYREVKDIVIKAHKSLYGIHSIGWDVAITNDGPVLIEGNDNWEISLMQISRGLKKEWYNMLYKERKNEK